MVFDKPANPNSGDSSNNSKGLYDDLYSDRRDLADKTDLLLARRGEPKKGTPGANSGTGNDRGDSQPVGTEGTSGGTESSVAGTTAKSGSKPDQGEAAPAAQRQEQRIELAQAGKGSPEPVNAASANNKGKLEKVDLTKLKDEDRQNFEGLGISELHRGNMPGSNPLEFGLDKKGDLKLVGLDDKGNSLINLNKGELDDKHGAGWHLMDKDGNLTPLPNANISFSPKDGTFVHSGIPGLGKDLNRAYRTDYSNGTTTEGRFADDGKGGKKFVADAKDATTGSAPAAAAPTAAGVKSGTLAETLAKIRAAGNKAGLSTAEIQKQIADARSRFNEEKKARRNGNGKSSTDHAQTKGASKKTNIPLPPSLDEIKTGKPVAKVEPAKPVAKVEPAKPVAKVEPAKPVAKVEPAKPVAKVEPAKPVAKVEPAKPVAKVEPAKPVAKVEPAKPVAKVEPAKPVAKVEPAKPVAKVEPAKPVAKVEPAKPVAKVEPAKPVAKVEPAKPVAKVEPAKPVAKVEPAKPVAKVEPAKPVAKVEPAKPVAKVEPAKPVAKVELAKPVTKPVDAGKSADARTDKQREADRELAKTFAKDLFPDQKQGFDKLPPDQQERIGEALNVLRSGNVRELPKFLEGGEKGLSSESFRAFADILGSNGFKTEGSFSAGRGRAGTSTLHDVQIVDRNTNEGISISCDAKTSNGKTTRSYGLEAIAVNDKATRAEDLLKSHSADRAEVDQRAVMFQRHILTTPSSELAKTFARDLPTYERNRFNDLPPEQKERIGEALGALSSGKVGDLPRFLRNGETPLSEKASDAFRDMIASKGLKTSSVNHHVVGESREAALTIYDKDNKGIRISCKTSEDKDKVTRSPKVEAVTVDITDPHKDFIQERSEARSDIDQRAAALQKGILKPGSRIAHGADKTKEQVRAGEPKKGPIGPIEKIAGKDLSDADKKDNIDTRYVAREAKPQSSFAMRNNELVRIGTVEKGPKGEDVNKDIRYKFTAEELAQRGVKGQEPGWFHKNKMGEWVKDANQTNLFVPEQGLYIFQTDATHGVGVNLRDKAKDGSNSFAVALSKDSQTSPYKFTRRDDKGNVTQSWTVPEAAKSTKPQLAETKPGGGGSDSEKKESQAKPSVLSEQEKDKIEESFKQLKDINKEIATRLLSPLGDAINFAGLRDAAEKGLLPSDLVKSITSKIDRYDHGIYDVMDGIYKPSVYEQVDNAFNKSSYDRDLNPNSQVAQERADALRAANQLVNNTVMAARKATSDESMSTLSKPQMDLLKTLINKDQLEKLAGTTIPKIQTDINSAVALLPGNKPTNIAEPGKAPDRPVQAAGQPGKAPDRPAQAAGQPGKAPDRPAQAGAPPTKAPDRPATPQVQRDVVKPPDKIPDGSFAKDIKKINKADIEKELGKNLAAQLSDQNTGVKLDHVYVANYPGVGQTIAGFDQDGKQILLRGGNGDTYINPNQQELSNLGNSDGKLGWYMKDDKGLHKTKYDDYRFSPHDGLFIVRQNDGSASAWSVDGKTVKGSMNATGAFTQTNPDGSKKSMRRADNTEVIPLYDNKNPKDASGKFAPVGLEERDANGQVSAVWNRRGNDLVRQVAPGEEEIRKNVDFDEFNRNGNLVFENADGLKTIIRGDGTTLFAKSDKYPGLPEFKFDDQGRISEINGNISRQFAYIGDSNELASVTVHNPSYFPDLNFVHERQGNSQTWTCRAYDKNNVQYSDPNGNPWWAPQGEHKLSPAGDYSIQAFIGPNQREVKRVSHAYGADEYLDLRPNIQPDGSRVTTGYDAVSGNAISVGVTNSDGSQGMHYSYHPAVFDSNGGMQSLPYVLEVNPYRTGEPARKWVQTSDGNYQLAASRSNEVLPSPQSQPPTRSNFYFYDNGTATFLDERGRQCRQNANGTKDITYISGGQSLYQRLDKSGYPIRTGTDENNYFQYDLDANHQVVRAYQVVGGGEPTPVQMQKPAVTK